MENTFELIKEELSKNQLIYLRSKTNVKVDKISCGLLQLVPWDEEVVSKAKKVYVEKDLKVEREEIIIEI